MKKGVWAEGHLLPALSVSWETVFFLGLLLLWAVLSAVPADVRAGNRNNGEQLLLEIESRTRDLRDRFDALKPANSNLARPLVSLTALEQFAGFAREDLEEGKLERAAVQLEELRAVADLLDGELTALEQGGASPRFPVRIPSPLNIDGGAFRSGIRWPDGTVQQGWPVILSGYGHFESVIRDVELMPAYGMYLVQIEMGPVTLFPSEGETDLARIDELITFLDRAWKAGVLVDLLLSPDYVPDWAKEKYPEIVIDAGEYNAYSVDSQSYRNLIEDFIRVLVPGIANHPALNSFCLANEPSYFDASKDPENRLAYNAWLQSTYGSVEVVSLAHSETYASFDDVPVFYTRGPVIYPEGRDTTVAGNDYFRFNDGRFAGFHAFMKEIIHEMAPHIPVHVKFSDYTHFSYNDGVEPGAFLILSQAAGFDSVKYHTGHDPEVPYESDWLYQNMFHDFLRSLSGKPLFNSENHVLPDEPGPPAPLSHVRNCLWQAAVHGLRASTMWLWERDVFHPETGEAAPDFNTIMHRPLAVVEHGRTALDMLRLGEEIHALGQSRARVAILYPASTLSMNPRYGDDGVFLYEALNFTGEKIDFISDGQLIEGKGHNYEMIFAAGVTHLPADAFAPLKAYAQGGGRLVLIGESSLGYDHLNRPVDILFPSATRLASMFSEELRPHLVSLLEGLPGGRPVRVLATGEGKEPWGVEWLHTEYEGSLLINMTSYLKEPVTIELPGIPEDGRLDLITMEEKGKAIVIKPLETLLIRVPLEYPKVDVKANHGNGPVLLEEGEPVLLDISLDTGAYEGSAALCRLVFDTPLGFFSYDPATGWGQGMGEELAFSLTDLREVQLPHMTLPVGEYRFGFIMENPETGNRWDIVEIEVK